MTNSHYFTNQYGNIYIGDTVYIFRIGNPELKQHPTNELCIGKVIDFDPISQHSPHIAYKVKVKVNKIAYLKPEGTVSELVNINSVRSFDDHYISLNLKNIKDTFINELDTIDKNLNFNRHRIDLIESNEYIMKDLINSNNIDTTEDTYKTCTNKYGQFKLHDKVYFITPSLNDHIFKQGKINRLCHGRNIDRMRVKFIVDKIAIKKGQKDFSTEYLDSTTGNRICNKIDDLKDIITEYIETKKEYRNKIQSYINELNTIKELV